MNKRTAYWLVGGAVIGTAIVAVTAATAKPAHQRVTGLPSTRRLTWSASKVDGNYWYLGAAVPLLDGQPILRSDVARSREFSKEFRVSAALRQALLPADADKREVDRYSKELYSAPSWLVLKQAESVTASDLASAINGTPVDEFGRLKPGHYGEESQNLWNQTLGGLLKNKLFAAVATVAVLAAPGGIAVYGAYTMWQMRGKDLTLKNVAMQSARAAVVAQCGPGCGVAFDMGVGAANGESIDKSAEKALVTQMTPGERTAYEAAKKQV